jgi:hypothetical protein
MGTRSNEVAPPKEFPQCPMLPRRTALHHGHYEDQLQVAVLKVLYQSADGLTLLGIPESGVA